MNVALGVVSHEDHVITSLDQIGADDQVIVISGTTAETYLEQNEPDIKLQKFDTYAAARQHLRMEQVLHGRTITQRLLLMRKRIRDM